MEQVAASCMARSFAPPSGAFPAICGRAPGRRRTCICCCGNAPETGKPALQRRRAKLEPLFPRAFSALLLLAPSAPRYHQLEGRPVLAGTRFEANQTIAGADRLNHI